MPSFLTEAGKMTDEGMKDDLTRAITAAIKVLGLEKFKQTSMFPLSGGLMKKSGLKEGEIPIRLSKEGDL